MEVPHGATRDVNEAADFDINDLYASRAGQWVRLEPTDTNNATNWSQRPYGWINGPKP
jgi:hypothetical protein